MNTVAFDMASVRGTVIRGCEIISEPQWVENEWRALANVHGALAVVVLTIKIIGTSSTRNTK